MIKFHFLYTQNTFVARERENANEYVVQQFIPFLEKENQSESNEVRIFLRNSVLQHFYLYAAIKCEHNDFLGKKRIKMGEIKWS